MDTETLDATKDAGLEPGRPPGQVLAKGSSIRRFEAV